MSEIKTLEQYAIARIERLDDENEQLKQDLDYWRELCENRTADIELIKALLCPRIATLHSEYQNRDRKYIDCSTVWDDRTDFDKLVMILGATDDTAED